MTSRTLSESERQALEQRIVETMSRSWEEGAVFGPPHDIWAAVAVRRWYSSERRRVRQSDMEARIRDLTKGLIEYFEKDPKLVGPLYTDYEHAAIEVAANFTDYHPTPSSRQEELGQQ